MRVSGERIRREAEESRTRSKQRAPEASLRLRVDGVRIDWLVVLWAAQVRGVGSWGLAFGAVAFALRVLSSRTLTIRSEGKDVRATIKRPWQRGARAKQLVIESALLRHWHAWFCGGLELSGSNASIVASSHLDRQFRPPLGVHAAAHRPALRPSPRAIALHLPNVLAMVAVMAAAGNMGRQGLLVLLVAAYCAASSLACCSVGDPQLVITAERGAS